MELIYTIDARCRDCYKCVRECPVKAIRIKNVIGSEAQKAEVMKERCVHDGRCVLVCPQQAKKVRNDVDKVKELISSGRQVVASLAPSFAAGFPLDKPGRVISALRKLGFASVQETAFGAELVAAEHKKLPADRTFLSSACPSVVSLVEKHFPDLISYLSPIVSPMTAHARIIKSMNPGAAVVFIGPCIAKKDEAEEEQFTGTIDAVLGFGETWDWMQEEITDLEHLPAEYCEEFDGPRAGNGKLFPLDGGMLRTAGMSTDGLDDSVMVISGLKSCMDFLNHLQQHKACKAKLVELLACPGGCVSGPVSVSEEDVFIKKQRILDYFHENVSHEDDRKTFSFKNIELYRSNSNRQIPLPRPSEEELNEIFARTGKTNPEARLNCGSCGYATCRDKAIAVYQGFAEMKMCIPYMRERAESVSNRVIAAMPNGMIIVNRDLKILEINDVAREMLGVSGENLKGGDLSRVMDPANFLYVAASGLPLNRIMNYEQKDLITREIIFPLGSEEIAGILIDITEDSKQKEQQDILKNETINRAEEVIAKQMQVAQEIAGLLGETTADTKVLLTKLIKLVKNK
ncbi:[Fe-Fe] hydrogenase large subunit C-terminal domain-containing protein [Pelotomaculum propionicicum]|uniref:Iron hydrogenase 1 n=1 Tax=Pelotomaculum propionicicum TaxID=258475 RepID=A0A4Y7RN91_9FIRM|nr:[Fe-Fe] hydrogenase large subunit C-terminal domain-containing protein [Pelotomaculum propionicicum]TEB10445.1 Iron hydrogenase 1 [Pelotomaculum propionicicum]